MDTPVPYALSLRQPWAALLAHGIKTIEVRRWPTARRGRFLIHAARIADDRPEAWKHVNDAARPFTKLVGGIIGAAEIVGCHHYRSAEEFIKDQAGHLNEPDWFEETGLYGFKFAKAEPLAFRKYPGWLRFFPVGSAPFVRKSKSAT